MINIYAIVHVIIGILFYKLYLHIPIETKEKLLSDLALIHCKLTHIRKHTPPKDEEETKQIKSSKLIKISIAFYFGSLASMIFIVYLYLTSMSGGIISIDERFSFIVTTTLLSVFAYILVILSQILLLCSVYRLHKDRGGE